MKLLSRIAGLVNVAALVFLMFTGRFLSPSPFVFVPQLLAVALAFWARRSFAPRQFSVHPEPRQPHLIEAGPYRWIRHPMYTAMQAMVWSGVLPNLSPLTLAVGALAAFAVAVRVTDEEKLLRERVPGYDEYARRTKRFVPFLF
jgi:protein-S-isoprenylcysteine O-methyltransferase Ste14